MQAGMTATAHLQYGLAVEFGGSRPYPVVASQTNALEASRRMYGQASDLSQVDSGWGNPYRAMAESLVAGLGLNADGGDGSVDVVVIAYDGMDCGPWEHLGCRLTEVVAGRPRAFAISGQGTAGPFTAMRIASILVGSRAAGRALVLMLEHRQVPVDPGVATPERDIAVGFVLGPSGPVRLTRVEVTAHPGGGSPPESADDVDNDDAGPGLAVWAELARSLQRGTELVLTRLEPTFGYSCELRAAP
jgi:hypothetical protein